MNKMDKKKVLYFMPDNPFWSQAGNLTRTKHLLNYFESQNRLLEVDFLSCLFWNEDSIISFKNTYPHVNLHVVSMHSDKKNRIKYFFEDKVPRIIQQKVKKPKLNLIKPIVAKRIKELLGKKRYDIIVVSYSTWGTLLREFDVSNAYTIIDTHDFMTLQLKKSRPATRISSVLEEEMQVLSLYNEIWTYSVEEQYVFEQFTGKKVTLLPVSFPVGNVSIENSKDIEMLFVASDNPHNLEGIDWFIQRVLPLIPDFKLHLVGKICDVVVEHPQVIKYGVVTDLDKIYHRSQITICPLQSGTGIKIKVLESLSFGVPVVCSRRGLDGLVNKINNGCSLALNENEFAFHITRLLKDSVFREEQRINALALFENFYTPEREESILNRTFLGI